MPNPTKKIAYRPTGRVRYFPLFHTPSQDRAQSGNIIRLHLFLALWRVQSAKGEPTTSIKNSLVVKQGRLFDTITSLNYCIWVVMNQLSLSSVTLLTRLRNRAY